MKPAHVVYPSASPLRAWALVGLMALSACGSEAAPPETEPETAEPPTEPTTRPEPAPPAAPERDELRHCTSHDECVIAVDACSWEVAVRADQAEAFERRERSRRPDTSCADLPAVRGEWERAAAFCDEELCHAVPRGRRCESALDCEVIGGVCAEYFVVNHGAAPEIRGLRTRQGARGACADGAHAPPLVPSCREHACVGEEIGYASLRRGCRGPGQCTAIRGVCNAWEVISTRRRREAEARFEMLRERAECADAEPTEAPTVACVNDYCVPGEQATPWSRPDSRRRE